LTISFCGRGRKRDKQESEKKEEFIRNALKVEGPEGQPEKSKARGGWPSSRQLTDRENNQKKTNKQQQPNTPRRKKLEHPAEVLKWMGSYLLTGGKEGAV